MIAWVRLLELGLSATVDSRVLEIVPLSLVAALAGLAILNALMDACPALVTAWRGGFLPTLAPRECRLM